MSKFCIFLKVGYKIILLSMIFICKYMCIYMYMPTHTEMCISMSLDYAVTYIILDKINIIL